MTLPVEKPRSRLRIVALADSLALPRREGTDILLWEETWPSVLGRLLRDEGISAEVINCGARARTIDSVNADFVEHVVFKAPDVILLQVGVVDCAPRVFTRRVQKLLRHRLMPASLRTATIEWAHHRRREIVSRNPLARVYTRPHAFMRHLWLLAGKLAEVGDVRLGVLPIIGDIERMEEKSPGFANNVSLYNSFLEEFARRSGRPLISLSTSAEWFGSDGYHLTASGSRAVAEAALAWLLSISHRGQEPVRARGEEARWA